MNKKIIVSIVFTLFLIVPTIFADINIETVNHQKRNIQGGSIFFNSIITKTFNSQIETTLIVTKPDGTTSQINLQEIFENTYQGTYFDTEQNGTYYWTLIAEKNPDQDTITGNFTIADFSIDSVDFVETVKKVQSVNKITNQTMMQVFGTEYQVGDDMRMYLQLLEGNQKITNATCYADIAYPDRTIWQKNAPMFQYANDMSLYYYDLIAPNQTGVYMLTASCYYSQYQTYDFGDQYIIDVGSLKDGTINDTYTSDDIDLELNDDNDNILLTFYWNDLNKSQMENKTVNLLFEGRCVGSNGQAKFSSYNYNTSEWVVFNNSHSCVPSGQDQTTSNKINNPEQYINENGTALLRINATGHALNRLEIDYMLYDMPINLQNPVSSIRGGGEFHVTDYKFNLISYIWIKIQELYDFITTKLWNINVDINQTVTQIKNDTETILEEMQNLNQSINININNTIATVGEINKTLVEEIATHLEFAGGTEYYIGQTSPGKIVVQFKKGIVPLNNEEVILKIFYPNQSLFLNNVNMTFQENGIYYYDFSIPKSEGVYTASAIAQKGASQYYNSHTFHIRSYPEPIFYIP